VETFLEEREKQLKKDQSNVFGKYVQRMHGTVGAVAVDKKGNVAAGTSTGGTECNQPGRIGDSSMIGVGSYADNKTAAISCTGDGEYLISEVLAHAISAAIEHTQCTVQEACNYAIQVKNGDSEGDMGAIAVDAEANVAMAFNSERMHRAWRTSQGDKGVKIYK
jgi:beta-aspartyl-peptidase (threonine type)